RSSGGEGGVRPVLTGAPKEFETIDLLFLWKTANGSYSRGWMARTLAYFTLEPFPVGRVSAAGLEKEINQPRTVKKLALRRTRDFSSHNFNNDVAKTAEQVIQEQAHALGGH